MMDKEQENTRNLIEMGADIAGNAAGAAVGFIVAGPAGSVVGAAATPVLTGILKTIGSEIKSRLYSERELIRAGGALAFAVQKIRSNLNAGKKLRSDDFFSSSAGDRGAAKEILEGILLAAQKEYQEKKVKFYGNLYANIAFESDIDRSHANYLVGLLDRLSFRQLCCIAGFKDGYEFVYIQEPQNAIDLVNELNELASLGIVKMEYLPNQELPPYADYKSKSYATRLYELFGLDEISENEWPFLFRKSVSVKDAEQTQTINFKRTKSTRHKHK
jgi:hypothetical protein